MAAALLPSTATVSLLPGREALPGNLVFYPEVSHVGVVGGWDDNGQLLVIYCVSSYNNTAITGLEGVMAIGKLAHYENYAV